MISLTKLTFPAVVAALTMGLSSCTLVQGPQKDPTRYYVLRGSEPAKIRTDSRRIVVDRVEIPGYLERKEMVSAGPAHVIQLADFDIWAEPLDKGIARVVAENLASLLGNPGISSAATSGADLTVDIVIHRFEPDNSDGAVRFAASYTIVDESDAEAKDLTGSSKATVVVNGGPGNQAAVAGAMSEALEKLSRNIAARISG